MPPDVFDGDQCVSNMIACFRRKTIFEIPLLDITLFSLVMPTYLRNITPCLIRRLAEYTVKKFKLSAHHIMSRLWGEGSGVFKS